MKRIFVVLLVMLFTVNIYATAESIIDWNQYTDDEINAIIDEAYEELDKRMDGNYGASLIEDQNAANGMSDSVIDALNERKSIVDYSTIDRVSVNANYGTAESGDCIAQIYMTYTQDKGPKLDASFLISISGSVGRIIEKNFPEINEFCIFWELPTYDSQAKASFVLKDGRMSFEDIFWPKVLSDAL